MGKRPNFEEEFDKIIGDLGGDEIELGANCAGLFEVYQGLKAGGFCRDDALRILAYGMFHQPELDDDEEDE